MQNRELFHVQKGLDCAFVSCPDYSVSLKTHTGSGKHAQELADALEKHCADKTEAELCEFFKGDEWEYCGETYTLGDHRAYDDDDPAFVNPPLPDYLKAQDWKN